jgi:predicted phage terminase large subunit-like protein
LSIYPKVGGVPLAGKLLWRFPSGGRISFAHLEHETDKLSWQGSELPLIAFDELTHFSAGQFWYLLSRNRSMSGVRPYVRATCNPDADSWVAELISWWIDQESGLPIRERAGVIRWFIRINDVLVWSDDPAKLRAEHPESEPKSLTFIPSRLEDNPLLMAADPGYRANLMALPRVDRERLLGGNWKVRPSAGLYFQRGWCRVIDAVPHDIMAVARGWDLASTPKTPSNDPDWTSGTKIGRTSSGLYVVLHHTCTHGSPRQVETLLRNTASADGQSVMISLPQDPGQAGKHQMSYLIESLAGYTVRSSPETGDKLTRFGPFSSQAEAGNVVVLRGDWNERWFSELESFPEAKHDDDADSTSRAFAAVAEPVYDTTLSWVA